MWEKIRTQLDGVGANIDNGQTLRCFMSQNLQAWSTLKKGNKSKETGAGGIEGICCKEVEKY